MSIAEACDISVTRRPLVPPSPPRAPDTMTAIGMPGGVDEAEVRAVARAESGVMLAGGQGALRGRVLQIGHMGPAAYPMSPVIGLTALGHALRRLGAKADVGAAVEAALAAWDENRVGPGEA